MQFNYILFLLSAFVMGFIAAIPIGATQLEIARRSINGYPSSAIMIVAGSVISDTLYGIIAFFGIAPFLSNSTVIAVFWVVNAVIMIVLGIWAIKGSKDDVTANNHLNELLKKRNVAFITGFSLAVTNPLMIIWWLLGAQIVIQFGFVSNFRTADYIVFLLAGAAGIASYLSLLTLGTYKAKKLFSVAGIRKLSFVFGTILFALAGYFIFKSAESFMNFKIPSI